MDSEWNYDLVREGEDRVLKIDCNTYEKIPSIENDPNTMSKTIDILIKVKNATKIVFSQKRDYEYDMNQTLLLMEIATAFSTLYKNRDKLSLFDASQDIKHRSWYIQRQNEINNLLFFSIKQDPVSAFVHIKRIIREERIYKDAVDDSVLKIYIEKYLSILAFIKQVLEGTKMIDSLKGELEGFKTGDRQIYEKLFSHRKEIMNTI